MRVRGHSPISHLRNTTSSPYSSMFMHVFLFILSLILVVQSSHGSKVFTRDDPACDQTCNAVLPAVNGDSNSTTCTDSIAQQYATCLECSDMESVQDSQEDLDNYVSFCAEVGISVKEPTITGPPGSDTSATTSATKKNEAAGNVRGLGIGGLVFLGVLGAVLTA
ncbi:hypothetical protein C8R44DRAFT_759491 [Mycena epipterygia]|nr:hypothetical protein C8R44DRAFT_759491 [Mycena epipterygia]